VSPRSDLPISSASDDMKLLGFRFALTPVFANARPKRSG
jgi:hypothetical protein